MTAVLMLEQAVDHECYVHVSKLSSGFTSAERAVNAEIGDWVLSGRSFAVSSGSRIREPAIYPGTESFY